jgi:hypothetical protein
MRRRIWLLWTVPTLSLATCAAVVGFMTATEDWNGYVRREAITILDQTTQRATSIGWLGLFSPQTPGDGLRFTSDTEVTPHVLTQGFPYFSSPRTLDWTDGEQHLTTGWLSARIPAHFLVRCTEQRNEHLEVQPQSDGTLKLHNALGAAVSVVWLADEDGKVYTASNVPAGATVSLALTNWIAPVGHTDRLRAAFADSWLTAGDALMSQPEANLQPGCYLAQLDAAPFLPPGLASATDLRSHSTVFGILKAP